MPPSSKRAAAGRPQPYFPALLPGLVAAGFLASLAWFGVRYELEPKSEFRAEQVKQRLEDASRTDRFRHRAALLERHAERLDSLALDAAASDRGAPALAAKAALYRKWAGELETRAAAREPRSPGGTASACSGSTASAWTCSW